MICLVEGCKDVYRVLLAFSSSLNSLKKADDLMPIAEKLNDKATTMELIIKNESIGFASFYHNDCENKIAFISRIAILKKFRGNGYGKVLLDSVVSLSRKSGMRTIKLEVDKDNVFAIDFYKKLGFEIEHENEVSILMMRNL